MVSGTMFLNWLSGWYVLEQLFLDSWLSSGIEKKWLCAWDITNETSRVVCCIFSDYCVFGEIHLGAGEGMVVSNVSEGMERERKCTTELASWGVMGVSPGPSLWWTYRCSATTILKFFTIGTRSPTFSFCTGSHRLYSQSSCSDTAFSIQILDCVSSKQTWRLAYCLGRRFSKFLYPIPSHLTSF